MTVYADLEMGLHRRDTGRYAIELRFSQPDSEVDIRLVRGDPAQVQFDMEGLRALSLDESCRWPTPEPEPSSPTRPSRPLSPKLAVRHRPWDAFLRLRLFVGPSAPELHSLRWETLRDPQDGSAFLTSERLLFSRYLSSLDWRPVRLRPKADLRALVVVASPTDVANYQPGERPLAALDVPGELARAKDGLGQHLRDRARAGGEATVNNLSASPARRLRHPLPRLPRRADRRASRGSGWRTRPADAQGRRQRAGHPAAGAAAAAAAGRAGLVPERRQRGRGSRRRRRRAGGAGTAAGRGGHPGGARHAGQRHHADRGAVHAGVLPGAARDGQIDRAMAVARGAVRDGPTAGCRCSSCG